MSIDIAYIEQQLQQRVREHPPTLWGRKQSDAWDSETNFIYHTASWAEMWQHSQTLPQDLQSYAINRWFNFWSARGIETIFCRLPNVTPQPNKRDRLVDFTLNGIQFDHKTTVYPAQYGRTARYAFFNRCDLIAWLYQHQSQQGRHHFGNRLFVVLWAQDGAHWRLRADLSRLATVIEQYASRFDEETLTRLTVGNQQALSDVIWYVKKS